MLSPYSNPDIDVINTRNFIDRCLTVDLILNLDYLKNFYEPANKVGLIKFLVIGNILNCHHKLSCHNDSFFFEISFKKDFEHLKLQ